MECALSVLRAYEIVLESSQSTGRTLSTEYRAGQIAFCGEAVDGGAHVLAFVAGEWMGIARDFLGLICAAIAMRSYIDSLEHVREFLLGLGELDWR